MLTFIKTFARDESGATAIEYGLIAALIAVVIIGGVTALGENIDAVFDDVASEIQPGADGG
jgi:pilus assembly protein Flp/PilA